MNTNNTSVGTNQNDMMTENSRLKGQIDEMNHKISNKNHILNKIEKQNKDLEALN